METELHRRPGHASEALEAFCEELEHLVIDHEDVAAPEPSEVVT